MYSEKFQKSIAAVEAAREKNIALEPDRMTAKQKEDLLAAFHPDYKKDQFDVLKIGPNKGEKVPLELAETLQANPRIDPKDIDLSKIDYDVDDNTKAYYFQQAQNGLYARQAIICKALGIDINK